LASSQGDAGRRAIRTGQRVGHVGVLSGGHDVLRLPDDAQLVQPGNLLPPHRIVSS
jgi:hypothetical protein